MTASGQRALLDWFQLNARDLPWRQTQDPYKIWISETMLQQTTSRAVIPFYNKFLKRFPTVKTLAAAKLEDVFEQWAGLGYYSRARNLHKAAQILAQNFPTTHTELLELPGFGPYTSRSVASLAFKESVGVLDGNVIRILSRLHDLEVEWWKPKARTELQTLADKWVQNTPSEKMNQAMMELGATICLPQNPTCLMCPLQAKCDARKNNTVAARPLKKPKREREIWIWETSVVEKNGRVLLMKSTATPFFKNQWLLPGQAKRVKVAPKTFHFRHSITHHDIFVTVRDSGVTLSKEAEQAVEFMWVKKTELRRHVPASLVEKAMAARRSR
jgi:A/G-specific adenine glycosylase